MNVDFSALIACSWAATAAVEQVFLSKADTGSDVCPGKRQGRQHFVLTVSIEIQSHLQTFRVEMLLKGSSDSDLALERISN